MRETRRNYPREFKTEAVELLLSSNQAAKQIASDLGIDANMLHRWKREYLASKERAFPGVGQNGDTDEKSLRAMQKQLREMEEERDILKKALAIFSKQPR